MSAPLMAGAAGAPAALARSRVAAHAFSEEAAS